MDDLVIELERKGNEMTLEYPTKLRLLQAASYIRNLNHSQVYNHLIHCLNLEQQLLYQSEHSPKNETNEVTRMINQLVNCVRTNEDLKRDWIRQGERYRCELNDLTENCSDVEMNDNFENEEQEKANILLDIHKAALVVQFDQLNQDRNALAMKFKDTIDNAEIIVSKVIDHYLKHWKVQQKLYGSNAAKIGANLDTIQTWCESLAENLWNIREQIRVTQNYQQSLTNADEIPQNGQFALTELHTNVTKVLHKLVDRSLIVLDQPPQVMKTNIRFSASVRLLVGNVLSIKIINPEVTVVIVSEVQAQRIQQTDNFSGSPCGEIINGRSTMEYSETTRQLTATFRNMQLKAFRRPGRRSTESVTDEKFALWFQSHFQIGEFEIHQSVMSLPVVVTVHGIQEPQAWATILWDNSFSDIDRNPFSVPDKVPWKQFAEALHRKCLTYNERGLTQENLHCLAE